MAEVRFLFDSLLICVWVSVLRFLKSGGNAPCLIYISMHITRLNFGLQNHARVLGALCCFLISERLLFFVLCSIIGAVYVFLVLVLYFLVLNTKPGSASQLRCSHL
jgi:hypothetical protein